MNINDEAFLFLIENRSMWDLDHNDECNHHNVDISRYRVMHIFKIS